MVEVVLRQFDGPLASLGEVVAYLLAAHAVQDVLDVEQLACAPHVLHHALRPLALQLLLLSLLGLEIGKI